MLLLVISPILWVITSDALQTMAPRPRLLLNKGTTGMPWSMSTMSSQMIRLPVSPSNTTSTRQLCDAPIECGPMIAFRSARPSYYPLISVLSRVHDSTGAKICISSRKRTTPFPLRSKRSRRPCLRAGRGTNQSLLTAIDRRPRLTIRRRRGSTMLGFFYLTASNPPKSLAPLAVILHIFRQPGENLSPIQI